MGDTPSNPTTVKESTDNRANLTSQPSDSLLAYMIDLRKTMTEVLNLLLFSENNDVIDQALLRILNFFDVDRVYVGSFQEDNQIVDVTHEVTCDGVISMREDLLRQLTREDIPWWFEEIGQGRDIIINDVSQMPEAAHKEQEVIQMQSILSLLVIPIFKNGAPIGFIGLDSVRRYRRWNALDLENLRILTDIISIAIDRKQAQGLMEHTTQQFMKSESKFQIIFDKMPWGAELYDENGYLKDINQADLDIFGTTREEVLGVNMFENPNIPKSVNQELKEGKDVFFTLDYNFDVASRKGYYDSRSIERVKHLLVKGVALKDPQDHIFGYIYIVFDDSENFKKREQAEDNLARLKASVDTGDSILWEYDIENDELVVDFGLNKDITNNKGLKAIHDYNFQNLESYKASIHPDDYDRVYNKRFKPLIEGKINNFVVAYRRILNGEMFWFNSNVRPYKFNADGTPSKIISYTSNITEQREKEIELIKVKEADKLKSAFLANMSHEIRTPLNAIIGFSDIIAEVSDECERQSYLDIIHKNNDLLLQLIDDILDFSKIETGTMDYHFEEVDIKEICGEIALANSIKMPSGVDLVFDHDLPSIIVKTDERRVMQILSNFINNAIKFTTSGSITIYYYKEGDYVKLCVKDTGIGISEENQRRIFERFIKVDNFQQGTGLGLTISRTIIEALYGTIGVDSTEGVGSTFWFTLPLEKEETDAESALDTPIGIKEPSKPNKNYSILIAEDVYENYFLLETILGKRYQLYHAWNGQEAIDMFETYHPDIILMDIKMPVMDGFEATRKIRALSKVPIIALTAFAFERDKKTARECEFTDYVVKPINIKELKILIERILG